MEALKDLGLSSYETKAYMNLLKGMRDARTVSNETNVPFGRIYDVLGSLEDKKLVVKQDSRPKKFVAVKPGNAVKKLLEKKRTDLQAEIQLLTRKAMKLEEELNSVYRKEPGDSLFWNVSVGEDIIKSYLDKITEADSELLAYVELSDSRSAIGEEEITAFMEAVVDLIDREVLVKLLFGISTVEDLNEMLPIVTPFMQYLEHENLEMKTTPTITNPFDVMDGEKVVLKIRNPARPAEHVATLYMWQKEFATELKSTFNQMWEEASGFSITINTE